MLCMSAIVFLAQKSDHGLFAEAFLGGIRTTRIHPRPADPTSSIKTRSTPFVCFASSSSKPDPSANSADWFKQKPGESDITFIKRITSTSPPKEAKATEKTSNSSSGYQRIEDWHAEQEAKRQNGTMTWEEKVQFEGQRHGNQMRQNDILMRQINAGL